MDRVLKFRAWDGQCMYPFDLSQIDAGSIMTSFDSPNNRESWTSLSDMTVMQFTGLKDCKGVEIYEGDILSDESQMQWCNTCVGFRPHWMMTELICHSCDGNYFIWEMDFTEISIIGNIYENPELIEG